MAITKLDVLNDLDKIKICVAYRMNGKVIRHVPSNLEILNSSEPIYEELDGWKTEIRGGRRFSDLPPRAQRYIRRIEELIHAKVAMVSVGEERDETIEVKSPFSKVKRSARKGVAKPRPAKKVRKRKRK
jgi:adenylosuccinate synthase